MLSHLDVSVSGVVRSHARGRVKALRGASLEVAAGRTMGLVGPNGAGKSTLLNCVTGSLEPHAGFVRIGGRHPQDLEVKRSMGWLPERPSFPAGFDARGCLAFHAALLGRGAGSEDIEALLDEVGLSPEARARSPKTYSLGMKQRLGLAVALLGGPQVLILDEPTTGLDPIGVRDLRRILAAASGRGVTILLSSHHLDEIARTCHVVAFVRDGVVVRTADGGDATDLERIYMEVMS